MFVLVGVSISPNLFLLLTLCTSVKNCFKSVYLYPIPTAHIKIL